MSAPFEAGRFGSGQAVKRIEDPALVAGRGRYTDDVAVPGQTHLVFLRSPYAHARIASIDADGARAMPGVHAVITGAELAAAGVRPIATGGFKRPDGSDMASPARRPLAHEVVRYVGEPVVAVVADSRDTARAAADAVWVDYEELPSVTDPQRATQPGAPALCPQAPDNVCAQMRHGDAGATERAFAEAAHTVSLDLVSQRLAPSPIEPRSVLAELDPHSGRLTVRLSSQMPTGVRGGLCASLPDLATEQVRVLGPGDAYYFESDQPHRFRNIGPEPCELISACTPPTF